MKKIMDKFKQPIRINKRMFVFLTVLIFTGIITGSLLVTILSNSDKTLVHDYLSNFISAVTENKIDFQNTFINGIIGITTYFLIVWLLGISVIGIPIVMVMLFLKAFTLGFSVGSLIYAYKVKGIFLSFIYIFPHQFINLLLYSLLTLYSISLSIKIIHSISHKKNIDFKYIRNRYMIVLLFCLLGGLFTCLYEAFVMPHIIKFVFPLFS